MRQIGAAVIGCGVWGVNHARVYAGLEKVKLIKIADTDPERRRLAEKFDAECCADPRDIYRD
jgi:predicted dehydrogenase